VDQGAVFRLLMMQFAHDFFSLFAYCNAGRLLGIWFCHSFFCTYQSHSECQTFTLPQPWYSATVQYCTPIRFMPAWLTGGARDSTCFPRLRLGSSP